MIEFDVYLAITALSVLVICSYVFQLISTKTRIPTVLMLLLLGVGIRELLTSLDRHVEVPLDFIQFFGVLGLILILLEAGLDLNVSRRKLPLVRRATASALFVLAISITGIAAVVHGLLDLPWLTSFVYAAPLAVISSTIVASSIGYLSEDKREFLTYESALSDIFGILLFNVLVAGGGFSIGLVALNVGSIALALVVSVIVSVLLVVLLAKVKVHIKAFLIHPVLMLVYALGHLFNTPTLLTVLIFGLIINNWGQSRHRPLHRYLDPGSVERATETIKSVTSESAFLVRTVFFTLFGYTIDVRVLGDGRVVAVGAAIVATIFAARYVYLRIFVRHHVLPELFFAPRGLVTVVLFYSIPASMTVNAFSDGIVFFVVVATTLVMTVGSLWFTPREATRRVEDARSAREGEGALAARAGEDGEGEPAGVSAAAPGTGRA
ncbi:cation:proton antiporter [Pseudactinotalea sp. HY158]|uniref:cation:proton antiporter domain-containing protein n=1 Tax=Pseudactinotalea sp. HY158 TaxID=2654547 RepID=UPI00129CAE71|nr:cation:proton antiporter [Pseudactinotalea sp. HY158]QGH69735.1 hypothetical protein GCE65_09585 [Pseudactinotalea sp. HY158]